jgi:flavodoxin
MKRVSRKKRIFTILGIILLILIVIGIILFSIIWGTYRKEISLVQAIQKQGDVTYLVLFQNTLELRPTGGFVGNFAEVTLNKGKITQYTIYNTNAFDYGKPGIDSPQPFKDMLGVNQIQMRDGNWSPDFPTTAKQIIDLYTLEGGTQDIAGVIAINASVLPEILTIIGPVTVEGVDGELNAENVLLAVQYELNFGFIEKGINRAERKEPIKNLAAEVEKRIRKASPQTLYRLGNMLIEQANQKQLLVWSADQNVQNKIENLNWDAAIENNGEGDYFMLVDANLGSLKTDYYMKRDINKTVDTCDDILCSKVTIRYTNTAKTASPLNNDYKSYTRIFLPQNAFITSITGIENEKIDYSSEYDKKVAGFQIQIPFNGYKDIVIDYTIPKTQQYSLQIQKQPGIAGFGLNLDYKPKSKQESQYINTDWNWTE